MAVSASAKSRAAAVSSLIKRDAGFTPRPSSSSRHTGIVVRATDEWPTVTVSDSYDRPADNAEAVREVNYRADYIRRALDRRGYTYEYQYRGDENTAHFAVTGKADRKLQDGKKVFRAVVEFTIDPEAAAAYLDWFESKDETELAQRMADQFWGILQNSVAYRECALDVTAIDLA